MDSRLDSRSSNSLVLGCAPCQAFFQLRSLRKKAIDFRSPQSRSLHHRLTNSRLCGSYTTRVHRKKCNNGRAPTLHASACANLWRQVSVEHEKPAIRAHVRVQSARAAMSAGDSKHRLRSSFLVAPAKASTTPVRFSRIKQSLAAFAHLLHGYHKKCRYLIPAHAIYQLSSGDTHE